MTQRASSHGTARTILDDNDEPIERH